MIAFDSPNSRSSPAASSRSTNACVSEWLPISIPAATISRSWLHATCPEVPTSVGTTKNVARKASSISAGKASV